jgi:glyoxylase-like metal-dependent hydrolase (beta-lactamase superfamily II)
MHGVAGGGPRLLPSAHAWRTTVLRAGGFRLDGGGMFGLIPKTFWSTWIRADADNRIGLACNCLLLRDGSRTVLVETGYGDKWTAKERGVYQFAERTVVDALRDEGIEPDAIDEVVLTHLHFDHAAGLTRTGPDGAPKLVFPNARVHVQRQEWLDALANRSTMTKTYLPSHLAPIAERVVLADGAAEVLPGIVVRPLVGHTWGQQGVFVRSADGVVVFPGDLMPTVHHVHLSASMGYDMLPYDSMVTKREFLAEASGEGWMLVLDHEPGTPVVRVVPDPKDPTDPHRRALVPA